MWEVLLDAVIDTLKVLPILLLVYLLIEFLSHMKNDRFLKIIQKSKKAGPIFGSCIGIIPQCGFSALAADLFSRHKITIGTVVAVFLATSDEAIPILISKPESYLTLLKLIGIKLLVGIFFGFMIDIFYNLFTKNKQQKIRIVGQKSDNQKSLLQVDNNSDEIVCCDKNCHEHEHEHEHEHDHGKEECSDKSCCSQNIFKSAIVHALLISLYLFIATFLINTIIYFVTPEAIKAFLDKTTYAQPFLAALVGLIPTCASSIVLIELFLEGTLTFGALLAGLTAGSGIGILVLFKQNKNIKQNVLIVFLCYLIGSVVGLVASFI